MQKITLPMLLTTIVLAGCVSTPLDPKTIGSVKPDPFKIHSLGEVNGCKITLTVMSDTSRIYGIRCPQSLFSQDPIQVFNPKGNCTMRRLNTTPIHNSPKHQYQIHCSGVFSKAESTADKPMTINSDPLRNIYKRDGLSNWKKL